MSLKGGVSITNTTLTVELVNSQNQFSAIFHAISSRSTY
jgi:hypothetical protein